MSSKLLNGRPPPIATEYIAEEPPTTILRWEFPLAVLKWQMSPNCIKRLENCQFAMACHLPQHPCHRPPDDRPERRRLLIGRFRPNIQQCLAEEPLSNTSYKSAISSIHQDAVRTAIESSSPKLLNGQPLPIATEYIAEEPPATCRPSAAFTKMRSELPLKAAHQNCLMANRCPLIQLNRNCQGRQELYWHNCAPVTAELNGQYMKRIDRQRTTIATTVVIRLMIPTQN